jgi:hypothetical protein
MKLGVVMLPISSMAFCTNCIKVLAIGASPYALMLKA